MQTVLQDGQDVGTSSAARKGSASSVFAEEPNDDWGSLRADLDRALSEAQQTAVPQPHQSHSSQHSDENDEGEAQIPQTDGASDRLPWQQKGWSLSPHVSGPEYHKECSKSIPHSTISAMAMSSQEPADSSGSSGQGDALHSPESRAARRSGDIIFTPGREAPTADVENNNKVADSESTGRLHKKVDQRAHRQNRAQNLTHGRRPSTSNTHWIPQVDGSGDTRPRRLGSSWNRGKGRLIRQPSPVGGEASQEREQSQVPRASQGDDSQRQGSQKGSSQRYAALSMQQSPQKSAAQSHAQNTGQSYGGKPDCLASK